MSFAAIQSQLLPLIRKKTNVHRDDEALVRILYECIDLNSRDVDNESRTGALRCLLLLLPHSYGALSALILDSASPYHGETRFALFCAISDLVCIPGYRKRIQVLAEPIRNYMKDAKRDVALSLWMAGHLLSDHFCPRYSIPVLLDVLGNGRYVEGRRTALFGLGECLQRLDREMSAVVLRAVTEAERNDRSQTIRYWAHRIMTEKGGARFRAADVRAEPSRRELKRSRSS